MPLALLVCDLNGFKQINDRYGHLEGNRVLRDVSEALRCHCRKYDYVARMGGEIGQHVASTPARCPPRDQLRRRRSLHQQARTAAPHSVQPALCFYQQKEQLGIWRDWRLPGPWPPGLSVLTERLCFLVSPEAEQARQRAGHWRKDSR